MKCPKCNSDLIKGKDEVFETLCDHVSDPNNTNLPKRNTFICNNPKCECCNVDCFWDETGDFYGNFKIKFKDNISSAYPSFSRKMNTEIYKRGLKSKFYIHPCFMLWFLKPLIEFNYKSDEYGNVIKKSYKLKFLKKESMLPWKISSYNTYYSFHIPIIFRSIKHNIDIYKNCSEMYIDSHFKDEFEKLPKWDKRWWRHVEKFLNKVIFYKLYKKLK